jgi:hypothetical protein
MTPENTQAVLGGIATQDCDSHARASCLAATSAVSDKHHDDKAECQCGRCCAFDRQVNPCTSPMEIH